MILCICASPALDLTYRVDRVTIGTTNRVGEVSQRAGGKAINVARVLSLLGEDVAVLTTAGGETGGELASGLSRDRIPHELVPSRAPTRRTVAILDESSNQATILNEPARLDDWPAFLGRAEELIPTAEVVVVSGALPAGAPADAFAVLVAVARAHERPVVLDTSGPALPVALRARPSVVKPNADELRDCTADRDPLLAARSLAERWRVAVVASLGADGLVAVHGDDAWQARPARALPGNPTGSGDAVVAGLARGLRAGTDPAATLADCVALGAAAVLASGAGELDLDDYRHQAAGVVVESIAGVGR